MLALLAALAVTASAQMTQRLEGAARAFGQSGLLQDVPLLPEGVPVTPPQASPAPAQDLEQLEGQVNFEYAEMVDRFESLRRTVVRGKKRRRRRVEIPTGVTDADRVDDGGIKKIVVHASGGAGSCDGSVSHLLNAKTAAHFIVCRDGRVTRMVRIEDIANHVKNDAVDRESVGIETESGHPDSPYFRDSDWSPETYWKMYASLAWLIRAISKEAGVPRDRASIITHEEADRGIRGAHTDPGPPFDGGSQPALDARFPGQSVSPREFLMRLVTDDAPPRLWRRTGTAGDGVEVKDTESLGLAHIRVWRLDEAGKPAVKVEEWTAPKTGLPPTTRLIAAPAEPGSYRIVARDLVGNTSAAVLHVADPSLTTPAPLPPTADLKVFLFRSGRPAPSVP
ncbi:MAG: N-acetylmuramoyl-L-alanine amidase [Elusimicrobia bacterium]|nr:MAG: N-acetylmuramoyl-L-alanine amidase [Elusimicrobiota bacterium]